MNVFKKCRYGQVIYNNKDMWQGRSYDLYGEFSEYEVSVFRRIIQPGHFVLDVGANIGSHTLVFSQLVGDSGRVMAFEPEMTAFCTLCGNIALNNLNNVFCFQQAIGNRNGQVSVPIYDYDKTNNFGSLSLLEDYSEKAHYQVSLIPLDSMNLGACSFIKIDVEGMESQVIEGALNTIKKQRPFLYLEDNFILQRTPQSDEQSRQLRNLVKSLDYIIYSHFCPLFNPNNHLKNKENVFLEDGFHVVSSNILCVPKERENPFTQEEIRTIFE